MQLAQRWSRQARQVVGQGTDSLSAEQCLALSRFGNLARRRSADGERWHSVSGRGFLLDPSSPLAREEWLLVCDAQGQAKGARITSALALTPLQVDEAFAERIKREDVARWNAEAGRIDAYEEQRLGAIVLERRRDAMVSPERVEQALRSVVEGQLDAWLPRDLMARGRFAQIAALDPEKLVEEIDLWLPPLLAGRRDPDVPPARRREALLARLEWSERKLLDTQAPARFVSPAGTDHPIDYTGDDAPSAQVRVQAMYGLDRHPMIGATPLLLKLTSPAGRPVQATRDLPAFWRGSWADVRKDMKGRYPKHRWPEEPWREKASLQTKNAFEKSRGSP